MKTLVLISETGERNLRNGVQAVVPNLEIFICVNFSFHHVYNLFIAYKYCCEFMYSPISHLS